MGEQSDKRRNRPAARPGKGAGGRSSASNADKTSRSLIGTPGLADLIAGVNAAPENFSPDAWIDLAGPKPGSAEINRLRRFREAAAKDSGHGLDGHRSRPERLESLRTELKRRGLDGFIVPRSDEHQGEYVSKRAERLRWLTGFDGSAGLAIVLIAGAAVFVDGRYTLQADAQVDGDLYDIRHAANQPAAAWLRENLQPGQRLGFDPWLLTQAQARRYRETCAEIGAELVALDDNPLDAVWTDQPPAPISPVVPHPRRFAGETSHDKRKRLGVRLAGAGADAQVLSQPDSIAWLLNVRGADVPRTPLPLSFGLLHASGEVDWFIDQRKLHPKLARRLPADVRVREPAAFGAVLDGLGKQGKTVRIDTALDPDWVMSRLEASGAAVIKGADVCLLPKAIKNKTEIDGARGAHRRDGAALVRFLAWLSEAVRGGKVTEIEACGKLRAFRAENEHFRDLSFDTISGAGPNGAIIHYRVTPQTDRRLRSGSLFLLDSGGQYLDGTTDVTRTIAIGRPKKEMRENFTRVLKGHIAIARAVFPEGTTGSQLDPLARQALWEAGLDYDHGTGHGVGSYLSVHEGPHRISKAPSAVALKPGMVISNEPGYYKPGAYGVRIENLVLVEKAPSIKGAERSMLRFETLTLAPIDLTLVVPGMLTADEIGWLNGYHQRVWRELRGRLDKFTRAWLKAATRGITAG